MNRARLTWAIARRLTIDSHGTVSPDAHFAAGLPTVRRKSTLAASPFTSVFSSPARAGGKPQERIERAHVAIVTPFCCCCCRSALASVARRRLLCGFLQPAWPIQFDSSDSPASRRAHLQSTSRPSASNRQTSRVEAAASQQVVAAAKHSSNGHIIHQPPNESDDGLLAVTWLWPAKHGKTIAHAPRCGTAATCVSAHHLGLASPLDQPSHRIVQSVFSPTPSRRTSLVPVVNLRDLKYIYHSRVAVALFSAGQTRESGQRENDRY
jgi:hypothetical protein